MISLIDLDSLARRLRRHVKFLAEEPRVPGSKHHRRSLEYIQEHLQQAGFNVDTNSFSIEGLPGKNLLTQPSPETASSPLFIIGAHYDTKPETPGADDNASGVAALLELARMVGPSPAGHELPPRRLQLVAYDLEESGMLGSYVHSQEMKLDEIPVAGMISLEMLGYTDNRPGSQGLPPHLAPLYPDVGNFIGICGNERSRDLAEQVQKVLRAIPGLPVELLVLPGNGEAQPEARLSDHSPFWDRGFKALMITDTSFFRNPHYHLPSDTAETLDYSFLARITAGIVEFVSGRNGNGTK
jgi:Zn-dependent M28 family amino/carboxypeptidase